MRDDFSKMEKFYIVLLVINSVLGVLKIIDVLYIREGGLKIRSKLLFNDRLEVF